MNRQQTQEIAEQVTATILAALDEGTVPWRKPWTVIGGRHYNAITGRGYRGINQFSLDCVAMREDFSAPAWMTFRQAAAESFRQWKKEHPEVPAADAQAAYKDDPAGYRGVRKGEESSLVVFWKIRKFRDEEDRDKVRTVPLLRYFRVFNAEQTDLELEFDDRPGIRDSADTIDAAEAILDELSERDEPVIEEGGDRAYYAPMLDKIGMPTPEQFDSDESYYRVLFHELTHWTGHKSRNNRPEIYAGSFGNEPYAREELTAELGAAMMMNAAGIDSQEHYEASAAYIDNWRQALTDDPKMVIAAGGRAQRAVDYLTGATYSDDDDNNDE